MYCKLVERAMERERESQRDTCSASAYIKEYVLTIYFIVHI